MHRTGIGVLMLICALVALVASHGVFSPAVEGTANIVPTPAVPAVGACETHAQFDWQQVGCDTPHAAEVVAAWSAAETPPDPYGACVGASAPYLQTSPPAFSISTPWARPWPVSTNNLVHGPGPTFVAGWSWQACLVRPSLPAVPGGYRGRLLEAGPTGAVPAELRSCFTRNSIVGPVGTTCSAAHTGEVVAVRQLKIFQTDMQPKAVDDDPQDRRQCLNLASKWTDSADPTYGDQLTMVINLRADGLGMTYSSDRPGTVSGASSYLLYQAACSLEAAPGHYLSGSIWGIADSRLPVN